MSSSLWTPWTAACQASLSFTISWSLLKLTCIGSVIPFNHLILCHPVLLLPLIFPSIRVFSSESALCIRWPKYWSFTFSISPSNKHLWLISFKIDCFETLKSLLQHHNSKASVLWCSTFFMIHATHFNSVVPGEGHIFPMTEVNCLCVLDFRRKLAMWRESPKSTNLGWVASFPDNSHQHRALENPAQPTIAAPHFISFLLLLLPGRSDVKFNKLNKSYFPPPHLCGFWRGAL